jgi:hypothetical protein
MVHGTNYGIQLIVQTDRPLDYYNDILKLSIDIRTELYKRQGDPSSFVLYSRRYLENRIEQVDEWPAYVEAMDRLEYRRFNYPNMTRDTHPDTFFYYDVTLYNNAIKDNPAFCRMTLEEFKQLEQEYIQLKTQLEQEKDTKVKNELYKKRDTLYKQIELQRIVVDPVYYTKVQEMEQKLTDIELTDAEAETLGFVLQHPLFSDNVIRYKFELIKERY